METAIKEKLNGADITVHIEPCDGSCRKMCVSGCMMSEDARKSAQAKNARPGKITR
jgi:hypothetical protein